MKSPACSSPSSLSPVLPAQSPGPHGHVTLLPETAAAAARSPRPALLSPAKPFSAPRRCHLTRPPWLRAFPSTLTVLDPRVRCGNLSLSPGPGTRWASAQAPGPRGFGAGVSARSQPPAAPSRSGSSFQAPLRGSRSCAGPCCSQVVLSEADHTDLSDYPADLWPHQSAALTRPVFKAPRLSPRASLQDGHQSSSCPLLGTTPAPSQSLSFDQETLTEHLLHARLMPDPTGVQERHRGQHFS